MSQAAPVVHKFETGWPHVQVYEGANSVLEGFRLFNWLLVNKAGEWIWIWDGKQ